MTHVSLAVFVVAWLIVIYAYCVFPILLAVMARFVNRNDGSHDDDRRKSEAVADPFPTVTMIVAAHNEQNVLPDKLSNTARIEYPDGRFELLIGSDGSSDRTPELLSQWSRQEPATRHGYRFRNFTDRRGKISVLNDLVGESTSDIIVMSDANTMFKPDAISKLVAAFADPRVGCVSGQLHLDGEGGVSGEGLYWKYEQWIKENESKLGFLIGCNGGIYAMRRELYTQLPSSTIIDDFVLTMCVLERGYRVCLESSARASEPPCASARDEMKRKIRIGAGGWQALRLNASLLRPQYGLRSFAFWGHKVLRWVAPWLILTALLANVALARIPEFAALLAAQIVAILIAAYVYRADRRWPTPKWMRPISYFFLMNYALLCGFLRFAFGTQKVTWERAASVRPTPQRNTGIA
jgi:cellulose synthase/poly-beta-1,6-N-acetylglucosamine synthase-like glycosyltransferase